MSYALGDRVRVDLAKLKGVRNTVQTTVLPGIVLQRPGKGLYDVLLDEPPNPELAILSFVPEEALSPASAAGGGDKTEAASPAGD